jgi:hypothetical protein
MRAVIPNKSHSTDCHIKSGCTSESCCEICDGFAIPPNGSGGAVHMLCYDNVLYSYSALIFTQSVQAFFTGLCFLGWVHTCNVTVYRNAVS